jgi:AcrR family transcriptional regulator
MSTISARLGGSKGTLYNYFSSKEELFTAFVSEECGRARDMFSIIGDDGQDLGAALRQIGKRIVEQMLSDEMIGLYRIVAAEAGRFPELGHLFYEAGPRQGRAAATAAFERATRAGYLKVEDPELAASQYFELCLAGVHRQRLLNIIDKPGPAMIERNVDAAVKTFMAAFGA